MPGALTPPTQWIRTTLTPSRSAPADPSHAAGVAELVTPLAMAVVAAGADGLLVEVHPSPQQALSDGDQSLSLPAFAELTARLAPFAAAAGRGFGRAAREQAVAA